MGEEKLPILNHIPEIISRIKQKDSLIILSETGSGKTTCIPSLILKKNLCGNKSIVCTQPRRIAAISIAKHVSKFFDNQVGKKVGYMVRYEDMTSEETKLIFATDGSLLREALEDKMLQRYSFVILDEAHERTLHTDVLFSIIKDAQKERKQNNLPSLKILIMSATIVVDRYVEYFSADVMMIEGRQYNIDLFYVDNNPKDYFSCTLSGIIKLHKLLNIDNGILVFLSGQDEIESMKNLLEKNCLENNLKAEICILFSALPKEMQSICFKPAKKGYRKIILSTNISETSLTIPNINVVIDSGVVKTKKYIPNLMIEQLNIEPVSKAQARQRMGRAGRLTHGICYRMYTEHTFFNIFNESSVPEILRCDLKTVILHILAWGIDNIDKFNWFDKPNLDHINYSMESLLFIGAIDPKGKITKLGQNLIKYPLDPFFSLIIYNSCIKNICTDEVITIIAFLNEENIFYNGKSSTSLNTFYSIAGDLMMYVNIWKSYRQYIKKFSNKKKSSNCIDFCKDNNINSSKFMQVLDSRKQLIKIMLRNNFKLVNGDGIPQKQLSEIITRLFLTGFHNNIAILNDDNKTYTTMKNKTLVSIHPMSCLFEKKHKLVVFTQLVETNKIYIKNLNVVQEEWLMEDYSDFFKTKIIK